ncbi:MAG TPA: VWA domain-containing protein [Chthoniobacteraceae bacterium]|nr:VWA domain-containing protein [Chthoniobacteraceae bacterium]
MPFAHPYWFLGLLVLPVLIAVQAWAEARRRELLKKLVAARLQARLAANASDGKRWLRLSLLLIGLAFLFATLARPRWGEIVTVQTAHGRDIILAVDTSRSMLANDLAPNRLARVKLAAEDLIGALPGDRIGLVAFAGTSFLQAPLTADTNAVLASLHELDTNIIPRGGTNIEDAIHTAVDAFGKGESEQRAIVLFTDGEELDADSVSAAKELKGVRIYTVGAGSREGSIVALPDSRDGSPYLRDSDGRIVKSRLDEDRLRAIAEATGGFYTHLTSGPAEMKQIAASLRMQLSAHDSDKQTSRRPIERFQWPLSAAVVFLIGTLFIGERRRVRPVAAVLLALLFLPVPARASNPGLDRYAKKDYPGALQHFEEEQKKRPNHDAIQYDLGTSALKSGEYDKAVDALSDAIRSPDPSLRSKAEYNLGNSLFERGMAQKELTPKIQDLQNALQHYQEALRVNPKLANAAYNRQVAVQMVEQAVEEKKKKEKEGDEKGDQKKDGKEGKEGEGQEQQEGKEGQGRQLKEGKGNLRELEKKEGKEVKEGKEDENGKEKGVVKKKDGEIQATEKGKEEQLRQAQEAADQAQAAEEIAAALAGRMTEAQARNLLESLRSEDDRVRLLNPLNKAPRERTIRDW